MIRRPPRSPPFPYPTLSRSAPFRACRSTHAACTLFATKPVASMRSIRMPRSQEHTSELQSPDHLVCRLLLEKKKNKKSDSRCVLRLIEISQHDDTTALC